MESAVHASVPLRVGKKMRKRRELDALVSGGGSRGGRLLSASSDEGEPWGRRASRRKRSRPFVRLAAALALVLCVVSAATVLWLFVDVRKQIVSLRMEMDRVTTSSDSVGDALQVCHTASKELRANASELNSRLSKLEQQYVDLLKKVEGVSDEIATVTSQLGAAPMLGEMPHRLNELQRTLADVGSQIRGFDGNLNSVRKQAVAAVSSTEEIRTILTNLESRTNATIANVTRTMQLEIKNEDSLGAFNATVMKRIDDLQTRLESELTKLHQTTLPPVTSSSTTPSTTPSNTTTTTPAPPPPPTNQVPPAKPSILSGVQ